MKNVRAEFFIRRLKITNILPPDPIHDDWGRFRHPEHEYWSRLSFTDNFGLVELVVKDRDMFEVTVYAEVPDEIIEAPDTSDLEHQRVIRRFWIRALTILNNFILRYRVRVFDFQNHPINWFPSYVYHTGGPTNLCVSIDTPIDISVRWLVNDVPSDQPEKTGLEVLKNRPTGRSSRPYHDTYESETLVAVCEDVGKLTQGTEPGDWVYYETALELLMHAQEIVTAEDRKAIRERPAVISASLVTTASACEVFTKGFIGEHGTDLHKYIIAKKNFRVVELLDQVLSELSNIATPLSSENPELSNNIALLFGARNQSAHRGLPQVRIRDRFCHIRGWMLYDETLDDDEFEFFIWDVLAMIWWIRSRMGQVFIKPSLQDYWERQKRLAAKTRERRIYDLEVAGMDWPTPTWTDPLL
jgi:hypothetical protein